ncbi:kinase-like domain-containing protein [Armillaria luteobubalina]|uniref:Kinase-like domain-containing protein n=1 Tax=Armillaria luteobubalina TaxID=153913 RepID=A0AA39UUJ8_9AGAR|nr:kinase-like domain-containing protein [Armillaria luteobubalina]
MPSSFLSPTMDVVLSLTPVPCLAYAYALLKFIWNTITALDTVRQQLEALACTAATMLSVLDRELKSRKVIPERITAHLRETEDVLRHVSAFVNKVKEQNFLQNLYHKDDYVSQIDGFHKQILSLMHAFQISSLVNIQGMLAQFKKSQKTDRAALLCRLRGLEKNQMLLMKMIGANHENIIIMINGLQQQINKGTCDNIERRFFTKTLHHLSTMNTKSVKPIKTEPWAINSSDVELGEQIDEGAFGKVYKGVWHRKKIAIKVFKTDISPYASIHKEIEMWASLRHPNVLPFLGANTSENVPFIVTPYLRNGNSRKFVKIHPNCDRLKILMDITHGLLYLHSRKIVHGDLKAVNVLIDDAQTAVLCDFGLTQIQEDMMKRTSPPKIGSPNWMSPERLAGEPLRPTSDIYSFSMTIFELYTLQVPLAHLSDEDFLSLVGYGDLRPQRPESGLITDAIWNVITRCWMRDPAKRPTTQGVSTMLEDLHVTQQKCRSRLHKRVCGDRKETLSRAMSYDSAIVQQKRRSRLHKRLCGDQKDNPIRAMYISDTD